MRGYLLGGLLVALSLLAGTAAVLKVRGDAAQAAVAAQVERLAEQAEQLRQVQAIAGRLVDLQDQVAAVASESRALQVTLTKQSAQRRAEFLELLKNDQATRDWLALSVPAAVGVRYARPDTDDPAAWRDPARVPAGGVPAAGPAGGGQ